jgi:hypothetical protein
MLALRKVEAAIRKAIRERFDFTGEERDQVRRTTVYAIAQETGLVKGWNNGAAAHLCTRLVVELGGEPRCVENKRTYRRVRLRELELVPGEHTTASEMRKAWWARMQREGHTGETAVGKLKELPHYREYRKEINVAFFEQAASDYWNERKKLDIWGLYALEGLSVREIAQKLKLGRDSVHKIVQAMRRRMEDGQQTEGEETDDE